MHARAAGGPMTIAAGESRPRRPDGAVDVPDVRTPATNAELPGVVLLSPAVHGDARGFFRELWRADAYAAAGITEPFVQDNVSYSERGVLRGLHFQHPCGQGKLVTAVLGQVYDVVVDVRGGSPTFGRWSGFELSGERGEQLYVPPGFAHGFVVLSAAALFAYKCTAYYNPATERVLRWDDPDLGIAWPDGIERTVSARDAAGRRLRDFAPEELPRWT